MEGTLSSVACLAADTNDCPRRSACSTLPMWEEYDSMVHAFFFGKKLTDLLPEKPDPGIAATAPDAAF